MLKTLTLFMIVLSAHAGIMDFKTIDAAQSAYENKQFENASDLYAKVADKNSAARFDYANALYKSKKYAPAVTEYQKVISDPAYSAKAHYNIGNAQANMGKLEDAQKSYAEALNSVKGAQLKKDIEHNLALVKKKQEDKQQKKQDQNNKDQKSKDKKEQQKKEQDQNKKNGQDQQKDAQKKQDQQKEQKDRGQKGKDQQKKEAEKKQEKDKATSAKEAEKKAKEKEQMKQTKSEVEKAKKAQEEQQKQQMQQRQATPMPISDMQERKYEKMLNKRGIKTLMVPLESKKGEHNDEQQPW